MQRFTLIRRESAPADFAADVRRGLASTPKFLLPHYFYDALGSALFDAICQLPEYYPTRTETEILTSNAAAMAEEFGTPHRLIEIGSGSARKTRILFDAILPRQPRLEYVPVDVDPTMLEKSGRELLQEYDTLQVTAVAADFRHPSRALAGVVRDDIRNVVLFLGSTIGNLGFDEAVSMLRDLRSCLAPGDAFFVGCDLRKPKEILEPAYDDPLGVTAAFNLNLLRRINRELGADFDVKTFEHRAFYDEQRGRIEMHLVSRIAQRVRVGECEFTLEAGETIHTENSNKYDETSIRRIAEAGGFELARVWTDSRNWFADALLVVA